MQPTLRHYIGIVVVAGLVFFINLGGPKLWDRDEPRNAGCAQEMLERGDWVVPMFNAELRVHKPVLLYWFIMSAYGVFGVGEFGARFWSAVFGLGTLLLTYHLGRRLFSAESGFWAAIALASCMMFPVASRAATPDAVLIFFCTLAMWIYVWGTFPAKPAEEPQAALSAESARSYFPSSWLTVAAMYAAMGFAILAKGPVGLVLPTAVIGMFLLIVRLPAAPSKNQSEDPFIGWLRRLFRPFAPRHFLAVCWSMRPITALAVALAVAVPWYVWVGLRTDGEWPRGFFLVHHLQRTVEPMEGHAGPFFYYIPAIAISFFPWSLLLIPSIETMVGDIRRKTASRLPYIFVACWAAVWIGAFSLAKTKLPSYVTPSLPALALAVGAFVWQWRSQGKEASQYWFRIGFTTLCIVGVVLGVVVVVASQQFLPGEAWLGLFGLIPLAGGIVGHLMLRKQEPRKALGAFAISAVVFACVVFSFASVRVSRHQRYPELLSAAFANASKPTIAAWGRFEPSWVFYARQPIRQIPKSDSDEAVEFLRAGDDHFLITSPKNWEKIQGDFSNEATVLATVPYFMRDQELIMVGKKKQ